ncbi:hypothetical protein LOAG_18308 [Loa loa]|uniref:S9 family peptidase n=1 Tax=Loa loa TaxID=7209 RepID=A0A1I7W4G4_LOALO|nr:hypothetical protein LOAG_18308 [Loa loa]EJD74369.1 hypothetical protein LOAG_18308 [Loa loa]
MDLRFGGDEMSEVFSPGDDPNKEIIRFHRLQYNDPIVIRMENAKYVYSESNKNQTVTFHFLGARDEIIQFLLFPDTGEAKLNSTYHKTDSVDIG